MASNHIMLVLAAIFRFAISLNVTHFHSFDGGASHYIESLHENYVLSLNDDDANQNVDEETINQPENADKEGCLPDNDTNDDDDANQNDPNGTPKVKQGTNANTSYHDESNVFLQIMNRVPIRNLLAGSESPITIFSTARRAEFLLPLR